jgi:hypothetical protein
MTWLTDLYCLIPRPWLFQSRGFAWLTAMHREVCLKHRNNRREMIPAGALSLWLRAAVFVLFCQRAARATSARAAIMRSSSKSRMPECQSGDAGASPADRTIF